MVCGKFNNYFFNYSYVYLYYINARSTFFPLRHVAQLDNSGGFAAALPAAAVRTARAVQKVYALRTDACHGAELEIPKDVDVQL